VPICCWSPVYCRYGLAVCVHGLSSLLLFVALSLRPSKACGLPSSCGRSIAAIGCRQAVSYVNFCCLRAWMAGIAARRSAATGISAAGLQAWADGLWPPLPIVGLRDGHDVNFMNEFLNSLCSLCVRLLPCLPMRT